MRGRFTKQFSLGLIPVFYVLTCDCSALPVKFRGAAAELLPAFAENNFLRYASYGTALLAQDC
jgi:hypothetical protein